MNFFVVDANGNGVSSSKEDAGALLASESDLLELVMDTLVKMIVDLPLQSNTYVVHLEAINTLITILSVQMFWGKPAHKLLPYK